MFNDPRRRLSKRCVGVVSKGHNSGIGDMIGEKVSQPELPGPWVRPGVDSIAAEAVDSYDAVVRRCLASAFYFENLRVTAPERV
jgi:hypothetical protein